MATPLQYEYFKFKYKEEDDRNALLTKRAEIYLSIVSLIFTGLIFKIPDIKSYCEKHNANYEDVGTHSHVLTHETGHWLGLYHIFGQIGNSSWLNVIFGNHDDLIDVTPLQKKASAICYEITPNCPCPPNNIYFKGHKTLYNNFMDYNPCRCMFTAGQCIQMRNNVIEHKRALLSPG